MKKKGVVFLIPTYLSESNDRSFLAPMVIDVLQNTTFFLVENVRTARRFISSLKLGIDISQLHFEVVDKRTSPEQIDHMLKPVLSGADVGIISESGLPGLADPGSLVVAYAHQKNVSVIPLPGASSIQTALIASGFNGQQFTFHGYLPIQKNERIQTITRLEDFCNKTGFTQVFIETPYRNQSLVKDLIETLSRKTYLHISADLFGANQLVCTKAVEQWKNLTIDIHKTPAVFCIGNVQK